MILDITHFSNKIDEINQILWNENFEVYKLFSLDLKEYNKDKLINFYSSIFQNFPLSIENSSKEIGISTFAIEFLEVYYDVVEANKTISNENKRKFIENRESFDPKNSLEIIEDFISEFVHNLVYKYDKFLSITKNQHYFVGVNEEEKILLNILKIYKSIISDKTKQIDIFRYIKLNKKISDLMLEILIDFIEHRLDLLTINYNANDLNAKTTFVENKIFRIEWKGTQQELCELFIELENKKWIGEIRDGERKKVADSITSLFDLSNTKRNKKSNTRNSFYQLFKGIFEDNKRIYPFLHNKKYKRKFEKISNKI